MQMETTKIAEVAILVSDKTDFKTRLHHETKKDPATIPLLGVHPKKPTTLVRKYICTPMFTAALFTIAKI